MYNKAMHEGLQNDSESVVESLTRLAEAAKNAEYTPVEGYAERLAQAERDIEKMERRQAFIRRLKHLPFRPFVGTEEAPADIPARVGIAAIIGYEIINHL